MSKDTLDWVAEELALPAKNYTLYTRIYTFTPVFMPTVDPPSFHMFCKPPCVIQVPQRKAFAPLFLFLVAVRADANPSHEKRPPPRILKNDFL